MKYVKSSLNVGFIISCLMVMCASNVFAYIDPSVTTYAIQIIAGVVVAIGAVIGLWIRKAKKKVQDTLGIDENSKKEFEEEIEVYDYEEQK